MRSVERFAPDRALTARLAFSYLAIFNSLRFSEFHRVGDARRYATKRKKRNHAGIPLGADEGVDLDRRLGKRTRRSAGQTLLIFDYLYMGLRVTDEISVKNLKERFCPTNYYRTN